MKNTSGFTIDGLSDFISGLNAAPDVIGAGAKTGLQDALNHWQAESRNDAPIAQRHGGTLRRNIKPLPIEQSNNPLDLVGKLENNAMNRGFNYAYWQHNVRGGGGLKYMDQAGERNKSLYYKFISDDIKDALKKAGW